MLNRLRQFFQKKSSAPEQETVLFKLPEDPVERELFLEQVQKLMAPGGGMTFNGNTVIITPHVEVGDGKAEFLPDMSEAEVLDYERNERLGWKNFKLPR